MRILITGSAGIAGQVVARHIRHATSHTMRFADVTAPPPDVRAMGELVRCDTRTAGDVDAAVDGVDAVIHVCRACLTTPGESPGPT